MARSKKSGGEGSGNAILVIFLVLFILSTIGLGVAFWTGQQTVADAAAAKKKAEDDIKAAQSAKEQSDLKLKLYKAFVGTATEDDKNSIQNPGTHEAALKDEYLALMDALSDPLDPKKGVIATSVAAVKNGPDGKPIEAGGAGPFNITRQELFTWNWPNGGTLTKQPTPGPILDRMVKVVAERERMFHESNLAKKTARDDADQYKAEKDKYTAALTAAKAQVDAQIKKLDDSITAVETEKKAAIDTFTKKGDDTIKSVGVMARERDDARAQLQEEKDKLLSTSRQLETILSRQSEIAQDKAGVFPVNVPHGAVVGRKPGSTTVEISVGSDAGLRPGQTFTVQPLSTRTEGLTRARKTSLDAEGRTVVSDELSSKGTVEVVSVLGPNLSTARITDEGDPIRNSILKGDLLYNPLFRKNAKDHVVLVGIFDTNADGLDDVTEVARNLAKRGAIVDGYYDLGTRKWESLDPNNRKPGPGTNTTYVVRGWDFNSNVGDGLAVQKTELNGQIEAALKEAKTKGAQEVKAAKFLSEIGYSYSQSISDETTSAAAVKYMKGPAAAPDAPMPPK